MLTQLLRVAQLLGCLLPAAVRTYARTYARTHAQAKKEAKAKAEAEAAAAAAASAEPEPPAAPPRERVWVKATDPDSGEPYFVHVETHETTWDRPDDYFSDADGDAAAAAAGDDAPAPASAAPSHAQARTRSRWVPVEDADSGAVYYVHKDTRESTWDRPDDYATGDELGSDAEDADAHGACALRARARLPSARVFASLLSCGGVGGCQLCVA